MSAATAGELIPVGTRLRWMLLCRLLAITVTPAGLLLASTDRDVLRTALWTGVPWLLISLPSLLGPRLGRASAMVVFNTLLLGDGLLLCLIWRAFGGLDGPGGNLVWLHCAAITLLASFRTGVKLAVWQGLLALVALEATAAGEWGPMRPFQMSDLVVYQIGLLCTVLATAAFAASMVRPVVRS